MAQRARVDATVPLRNRVPVAVFAGWTLLVWGGRINNILGDDDLTTAGRTARLLLAASFIVPAAYLLAALLRGHKAIGRGGLALATWTTAVWIVRGIGIAFDDHDAGFIVVHLALAVVSVGLGWVAVTRSR